MTDVKYISGNPICDVTARAALAEKADSAEIGDLSQLTTTAKDNLVSAINEAETDVEQLKADLDELQEGGYVADAQQIQSKVNAWLAQHPEATTTVQDGSITEVKLASALIPKVINAYATPEMFGAVGDGVTDDTEAIQNALNASLHVQFATKTYICSNLQIKSEHNIDLNGATLQTLQDAPIFISSNNSGVAVNRVHIYNGELEGNSSDATLTNQSLIKIACFYSIFENLRFSNCYEGVHLRPRVNSNASTVENVFKNLKFNTCYNYAIYTESTTVSDGGSGNATDGRIEGVFINCPSGSAGAVYIGKSAGWLLNNIHTYGICKSAVVLRNASHTLLVNIYIEGGYTDYGLLINTIGSVDIANMIIVANNNGSTMAEFSKNTSSSTLSRLINIANLTLECNVDDINVRSINSTVDAIYASGIKINDHYGSISDLPSSVVHPITGLQNTADNIIVDNVQYSPSEVKQLSNVTSFTFELPLGDTAVKQCCFEVDIWIGHNYTSNVSHAGIKGYLLYRNSAYTLTLAEVVTDTRITEITATNSENIITVTFTSSLASNYGVAVIKKYPFN